MNLKKLSLAAAMVVLSFLFIHQAPAFSQTSFSTPSRKVSTCLSDAPSEQTLLKFADRFSLHQPVVNYQEKKSFLGGIFPSKNVPSRRLVAKLGLGLANEFSGFSWTADRDEFKEGGSIYPFHLGLTLQIAMLHGLFLDVGYQMNKEFTKTFVKSKGSGSVNYTEICAILNLIPPGSFSVDSEGKSYNEGYVGIGVARYVNKKIELRGKVADWDLKYEDNFGFLLKAGGQAHKIKWAQPFGLYAEVTVKYVPWKLKDVQTRDWDGDWEKLTLDEAQNETTDFTNIGIELRFGALLPIL